MQTRRIDIGEGFHLACHFWGEPGPRKPVLCVHGLTRNARDFDWLARDLSKDRQVIAVDVAGRGQSDWLAEPKYYRLETYAAHLSALIEKLALDGFDWVGTSMGGLIGIKVAAQSSRIRKFVLNDIGPFCPKEALEPISTYLGLDLKFADLVELEKHLRLIHAGFGSLTDDQWRHLAVHSARRNAQPLRLHYDPDIKIPFIEDGVADVDLWQDYDRISCATLTLRGAESILLTGATLEGMQKRGPKTKSIIFDGVGHAPSLMADDQIRAVRNFLDSEEN